MPHEGSCVIIGIVMTKSFIIRQAQRSDFSAVRDFYFQLTDDMQAAPYHPMWEKGVYPDDVYLQESIAAGELWVADVAGQIAASMVVNNRCNDGYLSVEWQVPAQPGDFMVLHTLGVGTAYQRRGIGAAMIRHCIALSAKAGYKAVRLDLIDFNLPAEPAYTKLGFYKCGSIRLYYESVGWQLFHMYEYAISEPVL